MSFDNDGEWLHCLKILTIGDKGCGKTYLNFTFAERIFPDDFVAPIIKGGDFKTEVELKNKVVPLSLSELPSGESYSQIRTLSYDDTDVALMCFSTVNSKNLINIADKWLPELKKYIPDTPIVLVGTKCDLKYDEKVLRELRAKSQEPVTHLEALAFCERIKAFEYVECSAFTFEGVHNVYTAAVEAVAEM